MTLYEEVTSTMRNFTMVTLLRGQSDKFCLFHNDTGMIQTSVGIWEMKLRGWYKIDTWRSLSTRIAKEGRRGNNLKIKRKRPQEGVDNQNPPKRGLVHMIIGGSTDEDSNRTRRSSVWVLKKQWNERRQEVCRVESMLEISFGPRDKGESREPHIDALVITTDIAGLDVAQIFVDTGSSMYILFMDYLWWMNLNMKLEPLEAALYGFTWGASRPLD